MKVGIVSSTLPFARGGGRFIVDWLREKLVERGHLVEVLYIPYTDEREHIIPQMMAFRTMKLGEYFDRVVAIRPPAHLVQHPQKVVWFIHHLRIFYDLWDTPYNPIPRDLAGQALRDAIMKIDTQALGESHRLFTNSKVVGDRLRRYNGLESEVLYPPVLRPEMLRSGAYGDEIVSVCRMEHHKRQHLLIEAIAHTKSSVRLRLCGPSMDQGYVNELRAIARRYRVLDRVAIEARWISEGEKADHLEQALASVYLPFDEDSYGYPTIEAAHARRCTITASDSGGVSEFVVDGETGLVVAPDPVAIAGAFDTLFKDRAMARALGEAAEDRLFALGIDWDTVITKLLS